MRIFNPIALPGPLSVMVESFYITESHGRQLMWPRANPLEQGFRGEGGMSAALPMISGESGLARYLTQIRRFPMLEPQEEYMLAKRWREHEDPGAAHKLCLW